MLGKTPLCTILTFGISRRAEPLFPPIGMPLGKSRTLGYIKCLRGKLRNLSIYRVALLSLARLCPAVLLIFLIYTLCPAVLYTCLCPAVLFILILLVFACALQTVNLSLVIQRTCVSVALINCTLHWSSRGSSHWTWPDSLSVAMIVHATRLDWGCGAFKLTLSPLLWWMAAYTVLTKSETRTGLSRT